MYHCRYANVIADLFLSMLNIVFYKILIHHAVYEKKKVFGRTAQERPYHGNSSTWIRQKKGFADKMDNFTFSKHLALIAQIVLSDGRRSPSAR